MTTEEILGSGKVVNTNFGEKVMYLKEHCIVSMEIFARQQAIAFFKWQRNNYSSSPNEEELIERYDEFEKENKILQSSKQ